MELTTEEIIMLVGKLEEVKKELADQLYELLFLADMAKYAKQKPLAEENHRSLKQAYLFVSETALVVIEDEEDSEKLIKEVESNA